MSNATQTSARMRIEALLDDKSFVEIGALVKARNTDFNMTQVDTPADGVITGYGTINGSLVYVYSQDASVLSGSVGEMHAKKIVNIYDMAMKMGAPVVGLMDCAGLRLQDAADALNAFGEIYFKQTLASLNEMEDFYIFDSYVRIDSTIEWAQDAGKPDASFKKSSRAAQEYEALAEEIHKQVLKRNKE